MHQRGGNDWGKQGEAALQIFFVSVVYTCCLSMANHTGSLCYHSILTEWWYLLKLNLQPKPLGCLSHNRSFFFPHLFFFFSSRYTRNIFTYNVMLTERKYFSFLEHFSWSCKTRNAGLILASRLKPLCYSNHCNFVLTSTILSVDFS